MKTVLTNLRLAALAAFLFLTMSGCKPYYLATDFGSRTADHKVIAVLPFEMVFTGKIPDKLTEEDMRIISEAESKAFMISFYNEVLSSTRGGKKPIRVSVQHYDKTLSILKENGIDIRNTWNESPEKLAALLGVDAVVKARIQKHRLMSDFASYGIDVGVHIIGILSDYAFWWFMPGDLAKSKEVRTNYSLIDKNGNTLWSIAYERDADWRQRSNKIIDEINHKSAKHFPYRMDKNKQESGGATTAQY